MFFLNSNNLKDMIKETYDVSDLLNNFYLSYCKEFNLDKTLAKKYILMKPEDIAWMSDFQGRPFGGFGLYLTPRNMAKLGQLYLQNGKYSR